MHSLFSPIYFTFPVSHFMHFLLEKSANNFVFPQEVSQDLESKIWTLFSTHLSQLLSVSDPASLQVSQLSWHVPRTLNSVIDIKVFNGWSVDPVQ